tara:strand:+ start:1976 stop:2410 length:435 start_codon:yes stop_codon:yes gene_type:complete
VPVASIAAAVSYGDDIPCPLCAAGIPLSIANGGSQTAVDNGFHLNAFVLASDSSGIGTLVKTAAEKSLNGSVGDESLRHVAALAGEPLQFRAINQIGSTDGRSKNLAVSGEASDVPHAAAVELGSILAGDQRSPVYGECRCHGA